MQGFTGKYFGFDFFVDQEFLLLLFLASLLGSLIRIILIYILKQRFLNNINNAVVYALLPPIGFVITSVISSNIALSLGMVGALSIVRFRTPIKNPTELVYYFMLITLGIVLNVNRNFAVNLVLYLFVLSILIILALKIIGNFDRFSKLSFTSDFHYLNIKTTEEHKEVYDNNLIHFSYDGTHYLYTFRSKVKNDIVKLKDSFKDSTIIDYSIDFSSDEG